MPDPNTIGALVAAALASGATEAGKAALGAAAKDAYQALKSAATGLFSSAVADLEAKPDSANRVGVIAEKVEEQPDAVQADLRQLAETLRAALAAEGRSAGLDNRITIIASGAGAIAAGRDAIVGTRPDPDK